MAENNTSVLGTENTEEKNVKATAVRPGDIVKGRIVSTVKSGTKWTYLRDEEGKSIQEVRNESSLSVHRPTGATANANRRRAAEPIGEGTIERMRTNANQTIKRKLSSRKDVFEGVRAQMATEMDESGAVSPQTLGIFLTAQADLKILDEFAALVNTAPEGSDLVGLQKEFAERLVDRLVSGTQNRTIVRQEVSAVSHLLNDCERESMARYIEAARWYL